MYGSILFRGDGIGYDEASCPVSALRTTTLLNSSLGPDTHVSCAFSPLEHATHWATLQSQTASQDSMALQHLRVNNRSLRASELTIGFVPLWPE